MAGLTAKQWRARFCIKLAALREIGMRLGFFQCLPGCPIPEDELTRRWNEYPLFPILCALVIGDTNALPERRAACGILLEFFIPDWRKTFPASLIGMVAMRDSAEVYRWRRQVLKAAGLKCEDCGGTEHLEAHHLVRWIDAPHLRVEVSNGKALCATCHLRYRV